MIPSGPAPPPRRRLVRLACVAGLVWLVACGGQDLPAPEDPTSFAGPPAPGGTVLLGIGSDLDSLNPYLSTQALTRDVAYHVFDSLLEEQADFGQGPPSFRPALARSWEVSADGLEITFHLHPDAVWTDGERVTAEDVRFSWQAAVHPDVAWLGADVKRFIEDVVVVDPRTVRMRFTRVYPYQLMDANDGVIIPRHVWGAIPFAAWRGSGLDRQPVSSGPFRVERWEPGQSISLVRNEGFYEPGRPLLDRAVYRVLPDSSTGVEQLAAGAIDFWDKLEPAQLRRLEGNPAVAVHRYPDRFYGFLMWNCARPLFASPDVRRALTLGIDRERLVDDLFQGTAQVASGPIPPLYWAHNAELAPYPHDPAAARQLLTAAGWVDRDRDGWLDLEGAPFRFTLMVTADSAIRQDMALMIQEDLKALGIDVRLDVLERNTYGARNRAGQFDAAIGGWRLPTKVDLAVMFATHAIQDGVNYGRYSSQELDALLEQAEQVEHHQDAKPLFDAAQMILHREQPYTFLYWQERLVGFSARLRGEEPNPQTALFHLDRWWVPPELRQH